MKDELRARPDQPATTHQIVFRSPESLRVNQRNVRTHSKKQIRKLAKSIKAFGFRGPILIDENGVVLAGHARRAAALLNGMDMVPTLQVVGLSDAEKRLFSIADNKIAEDGGWDREALKDELGDLAPALNVLNYDLTLTGFEAPEIDALFADLGEPAPEPEEDTPFPLDPDAVSKSGDLWLAGRHRILCGDALSKADLDRLMDGARAPMVLADVPYNQKIADVQGRGRLKHPNFKYASGEMSEQQYIDFLAETLGNAARVSTDGALHYVFIDWRHVFELISAGRMTYGAMLNICVWDKQTAAMGSHYRSRHEFIVVFRVGKKGHQNNIELGRHGRNRSNVWSYPCMNRFGTDRQSLLEAHPTPKPVALVADAIRDCTTKGNIVLDPFLGSGTSVLAAEKVGRRGYGVECEPRYVDVAIRRWEAFTKAEAILEGDGRTFAEVKAERLKVLRDQRREAINPHVSHPDLRPSNTSGAAGGDWVSLCDEVHVTPTAGERNE
jgi:DNA modification methylase